MEMHDLQKYWKTVIFHLFWHHNFETLLHKLRQKMKLSQKSENAGLFWNFLPMPTHNILKHWSKHPVSIIIIIIVC